MMAMVIPNSPNSLVYFVTGGGTEIVVATPKTKDADRGHPAAEEQAQSRGTVKQQLRHQHPETAVAEKNIVHSRRKVPDQESAV